MAARNRGNPHKHLPKPGIYLPGQEIKVAKQTDTVRAQFSRTGTVIEREKTPMGVLREVEVDERYTPGWDKLPGSAAASRRVAERREDGQRKTPIGGPGLTRR